MNRKWWKLALAAGILLPVLAGGGCSAAPDAEDAAPAAVERAAAEPPAAPAEEVTVPAEEAEPAAAVVTAVEEATGRPVDEPGDAPAAVEAPVDAPPSVPAPIPLGTPEEPVRGPEPQGVLGSWLQSVAVDSGDAGTTVTLHGDGQFRYSSFGLQDPSRFVLDLEGVAAAEPWSSLPGGGGPVERVRAAQFRTDPDPVTRVVVDLESPAAPVVEPLPSGLRLVFPHPMTAEQAAAEIAAEAAPQPAPAPEPEPMPAVAEAPEVEPSPAPAPLVVEAPQEEQDLVYDATPMFDTQALPAPEPQFSGDPIDVTVVDGDLPGTLRQIAEQFGLNIVIHPDVTGVVTVSLRGVPWDQALDQILKMNNLAYELEGNVMRVATLEHFQEAARLEQERLEAELASRPLRTVMKRVSYSTAGEIADVLRGELGASVLSQRGSVVFDERTNTLIIRELPQYMDTVLAVVEQLDVQEPQVHIEARIVETNKDFARTLGIQWGFTAVADAAHGNTTGLEFPNNIRGSGGVNLPRGGENGLLGLTMGNVLNTFVLDATLQAAESKGLANILSTPSVTVLNNERAEIQSGVSIPVQTVANNTVSVQFVNATLRLQVTPHVTADGMVLLEIDIQKRQPRLDLLVPNAVNAPIATKEAHTRVMVRDGGTTVIGGIYEVTASNDEDRVPGLANIPVLGRLFRNKERREMNEELLIFITPRVLKL